MTTDIDPFTIAFDPATTTVATPLIPLPEADPTPVMLTRDVLRRMDSCGDYIRRHQQMFPESRWPDGVEVNQQNCTAYYRRWDWSWAQSNMLNFDGQRKMDELAGSRVREVHEKFGTGDPKRAAIFGYLISQCPRYRSDRLNEALTWADLNRDRIAIQHVERAKRAIRDAQQSIEYSRRQIESSEQIIAETEATLPALEERAAGALKRVAESTLREIEMQLTREQTRLAEIEANAARQRAEVERLTALEEQVERQQAEARANAEKIAEESRAAEAASSDDDGDEDDGAVTDDVSSTPQLQVV